LEKLPNITRSVELTITKYSLRRLEQLEAESIHVLREVAASFERPVMLYSVGKDSSVMLRLALKAFAPAKIPFPLLHVDTGFKFKDMYAFRDRMANEHGCELVVYRNEQAIADGTNPARLGTQKCCAALKTEALLSALRQGQYDCALGGARRDEEKSRAKERFFSFRDKFGQWDPKNQRPELWNIYNTRVGPDESIRAFPISNWTELDVWHYILKESIPIVPLYFAVKRPMIIRGKSLVLADESITIGPHERVQEIMCRYRTLGCSPCTGAIESSATTIQQIIEEMMMVRSSERSTRVIDHDTEGSMEKKKKEGYF
jgi:sulfate adenylyltransferase subunit 2